MKIYYYLKVSAALIAVVGLLWGWFYLIWLLHVYLVKLAVSV